MIDYEYLIEVTISNNAKFYFEKYGYLKQGSKITVPVSELPLKTCRKVRAFCDECSVEFFREYQLLNKERKDPRHLCYSCCRINVGKIMDSSKSIANNKKRCGENHPRFVKDKSAYVEYRSQVNSLTRKSYKIYEGIINPDSHPRTLCGVEGGYQLDHKISIKEGFDKGIPPHVIAHVNNLQMLPWKENRSKW